MTTTAGRDLSSLTTANCGFVLTSAITTPTEIKSNTIATTLRVAKDKSLLEAIAPYDTL